MPTKPEQQDPMSSTCSDRMSQDAQAAVGRPPRAGGRFTRRAGLLALAFGCTWVGQVQAQTFPSKPLRIIVPALPGGGSDIVGRMLGRRMSEELKQPVIIDNKPGAGNALGVGLAARSEPDGYTLVFTVNGPLTAVPHVNKNVGYKLNDLVPIGVGFRAPFLVLVSGASQYKTLSDVLARGKPGKEQPLAYGSSGVGSVSHMTSEMLNAAAGTSFLHVPFNGGSATMLSLLAGDIGVALITTLDSKANVESGKLRPLAVVGDKRTSVYPNLPSTGELGIKGLEVDTFFGLYAPARVPRETLDILTRTVQKIVTEPAFVNKIREMGGEVPPPAENTPTAIMTTLEGESARFQKIVTSIGVKAD